MSARLAEMIGTMAALTGRRERGIVDAVERMQTDGLLQKGRRGLSNKAAPRVSPSGLAYAIFALATPGGRYAKAPETARAVGGLVADDGTRADDALAQLLEDAAVERVDATVRICADADGYAVEIERDGTRTIFGDRAGRSIGLETTSTLSADGLAQLAALLKPENDFGPGAPTPGPDVAGRRARHDPTSSDIVDRATAGGRVQHEYAITARQSAAPPAQPGGASCTLARKRRTAA